jgi:hypothetical protein
VCQGKVTLRSQVTDNLGKYSIGEFGIVIELNKKLQVIFHPYMKYMSGKEVLVFHLQFQHAARLSGKRHAL